MLAGLNRLVTCDGRRQRTEASRVRLETDDLAGSLPNPERELAEERATVDDAVAGFDDDPRRRALVEVGLQPKFLLDSAGREQPQDIFGARQRDIALGARLEAIGYETVVVGDGGRTVFATAE